MSGIAEFRIVVDDGPTIQVDYTPPDGETDHVSREPLKINPVHRRTIDFLIRLLREGRFNTGSEYEVLGENLFAALFYDESHTELNKIGYKLTEAMRAAAQAKPGEERLLRITLDFRETPVDLSGWPWEYLFYPQRWGERDCNCFIAQRVRMALTRELALTNARKASPAQPPLKVLLVAPSSDELKVDPGSVLEELEQLDKGGTIKLIRLCPSTVSDGPRRSVTFREFTATLGRDPHVIHFIGHGRLKKEPDRTVGQLAFTDETGACSRWVSEQQFANTIADRSQSLYLVFLQACESADTMVMNSYQTISGIAQSVSQKSVPAVVAMHYRVLGAIGNALSREFYSELAARRSVLLALNHARREVSDDEKMWAAFGLPVLYLRGSGTIEFDSEFHEVGAYSPVITSKPIQGLRTSTQRALLKSGGLMCPWDNEVQLRPVEDPNCPKCRRLLICPDCKRPRTWTSNKCSYCEQRIYTDAESSPSEGASSFANR